VEAVQARAQQRLPSDKFKLIHGMQTFLTALALVLIIEGLLPFFSPQGWRRVFEQVLKLSDGQIRFYGLASMLIGVILLAIFG
jgi:uncharacterized protein